MVHAVARSAGSGGGFVGAGYLSSTATFGWDGGAAGVVLTSVAEWDATLWRGLQDTPRHVIQCIFNPHFLSYMTSSDAARAMFARLPYRVIETLGDPW